MKTTLIILFLALAVVVASVILGATFIERLEIKKQLEK